MPTRELIETFFSYSPDERDRMLQLWDQLCQHCYPFQAGPYPAAHGQQHIENVLSILTQLIQGMGKSYFEVGRRDYRVHLFIAAMIHDVGMIAMQPTQPPEQQDSARREHASREAISEYGRKHVTTFLRAYWEDALIIAYGHAGHEIGTIRMTKEDKFDEIAALAERRRVPQLKLCVALLRLADLLDLGMERLVPYNHNWDDKQLHHLKKHSFLTADVIPEHKLINVRFNQYDNLAMKDPGLAFALLKSEYNAIEEAVNLLNGELNSEVWNLCKLDTELFGDLHPLGGGVGLFRSLFDKSWRAWNRANADNPEQGPFQVDMMAHSALGRFVGDGEGINEFLKQLLASGHIQLRVLLLDPAIESQQLCEVFEAQIRNKEQRCILDDYTPLTTNGASRSTASRTQQGDIRLVLDELREWCKLVRARSSIEVRVTSRILYGNLTRFQDRMVYSPYISGGLFARSPAIVLTSRAILYDTFVREFNDIWQSSNETRLVMIQGREEPEFSNPLSRFSREPRGNNVIPALDYGSFIASQAPRINRWITNSNPAKVIPPYEIEFQPSVACGLRCEHCIGSPLTRASAGSSPPRRSSPIKTARLRSIFDYEVKPFKVERVRISGLQGDPLAQNGVAEWSLGLLELAKKYKRQVVVFTNGLTLKNRSIYERVAHADSVHVSLDAATAATFSMLKSPRSRSAYENILRGIRQLKACVRKRDLPCVIGLGFTVTQRNASEVADAISLAQDLSLDFIRFKPDIRRPHTMARRTWENAKANIENARPSSSLAVIVTDVAWYPSEPRAQERCWSQHFSVAVGPDGKVYACDHLTGGIGNGVLGDLNARNFKDIWEESARTGKLGKTHKSCVLCPPFARTLNLITDEVDILCRSSRRTVPEWLGAL